MHVSNTLRLLDTTPEVQEAVHKGGLSVAEVLAVQRAAAPRKPGGRKGGNGLNNALLSPDSPDEIKQKTADLKAAKAKKKAHKESVLFDLLAAVEETVLARENPKHLSDALDILEKALKAYDALTEGTE
jgi:hypothetical protein